MEADDHQQEDDIKESMSDVDDDKDSVKVTGGRRHRPGGAVGGTRVVGRPGGRLYFLNFNFGPPGLRDLDEG